MRHVTRAVCSAAVLFVGTASALMAQGNQTGARMANMPGRDGRIERACGSAADTSLRFRRAVGDSAGRQAQRNPMMPADSSTRAITGGTDRSHEYPEYDVVLDIPNVCVQNIHLKVDTVTAKIELDARISNLVRISAGADVFIGDVDLTIRGVRAQALLLVDLDDVYHIVDQTLTFVDNHPEVVKQLGSTLQNAGGAVGGVVGNVLGAVDGLLLGVTRGSGGNVIQRIVDKATGKILERTISSAGQQIAQKAVGSLLDLPKVSETTDAAGNAVRRVRDTAGKLIEFVVQKGGSAISGIKEVTP